MSINYLNCNSQYKCLIVIDPDLIVTFLGTITAKITIAAVWGEPAIDFISTGERM